jgi:NADH-quinone oxidoreductase subunit F
MGHSPTVFEALPEAGGMLYYGIPAYRLPKDVLKQEIGAIKDLGVEIKTGVRVGSDISFKEIRDGFDAVYIASGADKSWTLEIPGEEIPGVVDSISFLRDVQMGKHVDLGESVAVVGGGNAAIDAARTAKRLGAKNVTIVYRRLRDDMPADPREIHEAEQEGIAIKLLAAPVEVLNENGRATALRCQQLELREFDKSGRRSPKPMNGNFFDIPANTVISAISQEADLAFLEGSGVELKKSAVKADARTYATSQKGVFAGGDVVSGPWTVIGAIGAGIGAAQSIDKYLGGNGEIPSDLDEIDIPAPPDDADNIVETPRETMPLLSVDKRTVHAEVELGFSREAAVAEAHRCLRCDSKS